MKQQSFWVIVIPILIALSLFVMLGTHWDAKKKMQVANHPIKYGLDIKGGVRAVLRADCSKAGANGCNPDQIRNILETRINKSGVGEATVQRKGADQFIVELPDVTNKNEILAQLGTTASMTFYYFQDVSNPASPAASHRPISMSDFTDPVTQRNTTTFRDSRTNTIFRDGASVRADYTKLLSEPTNARKDAKEYNVGAPLVTAAGGANYFLTADQIQRVNGLQKELTQWNDFLAHQPTILGGADIEPKSTAHLGGATQTEPAVSQVFSAAGAKKFADFTSAHTHEIMGIVLDDSVLSAPQINEPILDGQGEISGGFKNLKDAQSLADLLNAGSLPVPLEQVQAQSIEATLGEGAVEKSVKAGLIGLGLVLVFMLVYYRLPGLVANIALLIYALFTLAIFRGALDWLFPGLVVTLTLPGIAGFILSIGMAVDANILIFERLKEELRSGKSLRSSIDAGFRRAFSAIRDSNICTSITCLVLLTMGTPSVRGFAVTLLIGVLVSLFSAITVTRTLLYLLVNAGIGTNPALFGLNVRPVNTHTAGDGSAVKPGLNIVGRRKIFYLISLVIILPGLFFWLGMKPSGLKKSIEFTGGTQIQVQYPTVVTQEAVRAAVEKAYPDPIVQMAEGGTVAIVSVDKTDAQQDEKLNPVHIALMSALTTLGTPTELSFDTVKGVISAELVSHAISAVLVASLLIILYLAMVFSIGGFVAGLRFGTSAVIALLHDVLVLIGLFAIFGYLLGWKIDSLFVTALLTVIGFSVHDTVVIFDRVRENLQHKQRGEAFEPLVNRSIQQTLARSINTSLTVLMTLAALILFGGQTTLLLNTALFIGILSGTYSSIFNAASILVDWENWLAKRRSTNVAAIPAPALATVTPSNSGGTNVVSNGGSTRPLPTRPATDKFTRPTTTSSANDDSAGRIRPKKKKPARRF